MNYFALCDDGKIRALHECESHQEAFTEAERVGGWRGYLVFSEDELRALHKQIEDLLP